MLIGASKECFRIGLFPSYSAPIVFRRILHSKNCVSGLEFGQMQMLVHPEVLADAGCSLHQTFIPQACQLLQKGPRTYRSGVTILVLHSIWIRPVARTLARHGRYTATERKTPWLDRPPASCSPLRLSINTRFGPNMMLYAFNKKSKMVCRQLLQPMMRGKEGIEEQTPRLAVS